MTPDLGVHAQGGARGTFKKRFSAFSVMETTYADSWLNLVTWTCGS